MLAAKDFKFKTSGFPMGMLIGQHRHAGYRAAVAVINPVIVDKHPLGKFSLPGSLYFDMDINPFFVAIEQYHPNQFIDKTLTQLCVLRHGL